MSDHDDTLLDEDLGDEEYDLGNDEEEALLADDYEFERLPQQQTICKGEEETDDVLDLGVTDALDDLEAEEENVQSKHKNDKSQLDECYTNQESLNAQHEQTTHEQSKQVISQENQDHHSEEELEALNIHSKIDLRQKLREKLNSHREVFVGNGQGMEDDDCEEAKERRNRFQSERIMVLQKMNHDIPDSLENVVTVEQQRPHYRSRDRSDRSDKIDRGERIDRDERSDRIDRGDRSDRGDRNDRRNVRGRSGGRYDMHQSLRYHHGRGPSSSSQQAPFRAPLLENRPSFQITPSNSVTIQQHHQIYQHQTPQVQPSYHHSLANGPMSGHSHFIDSRLPIISNQFPESMRPQTARMNAPRIDYGPRTLPSVPQAHTGPPGLPPGPAAIPPGVSGPGPTYNCPPNQSPFGSSHGMFPNHVMHMSERGSHPSGQGPLLSMLSNSNVPHISANQGPLIPVSQGIPTPNFVRSQVPNPTTTHQNHSNVPNQSRLQFSNPQFESHTSFDSRNAYSNLSGNQFNNNIAQITRPLLQNTSQQLLVGISNVSGIPNISNVPALPTGHKILINPHFRGNQVKNEAKTIQDSTDKYVQAIRNASNSNTRDNRSNNQQAKSDDPYSYFSDVWQETKSQRLQNTNCRRSYSPDCNYSKSNNYNSYDNKYKSENQWSHRDGHSEEHRSSRDTYRELSPRPRNDQKNYSPNSNCHRNESLDHGVMKAVFQKLESTKLVNLSGREANKVVQKRSVDEVTNKNIRENSPKRLRPNARYQNVEKLNDKIIKKEDEMDPEMKEYRKKMEEQKRLREKILRAKENRRKLAAMEKQNILSCTELISTENVKQNTNTGIAKENTKGKINLTIGRNRLISMQSAEEKASVRVVRAVQMKQPKDHLTKIINNDNNEDCDDDGGKSELLTRIVRNKARNSQKTLLQKNTVQNSQKSSMNQTVTANRQLGQIRQLLTNSQRIVVQGVPNVQQKQQKINVQDQQQQQQQRQRIIMHKQAIQETKKMIKSNIVKVDNLAASTTEAQIRRMCQGIGSIENIKMGEGNATIVFKTQSAAMVFHKKYQRKMLDLSLIKVQLIPQATIITKSSILSKNSTKN